MSKSDQSLGTGTLNDNRDLPVMARFMAVGRALGLMIVDAAGQPVGPGMFSTESSVPMGDSAVSGESGYRKPSTIM